MSENSSAIAREKLISLIPVIQEAATKLDKLSKIKLPDSELAALGQLNDRTAIYLQKIVVMLADDNPLQIDSVLDFIEDVEFCAEQIDLI